MAEHATMEILIFKEFLSLAPEKITCSENYHLPSVGYYISIYAPRGAHSAKPASVREDIERISPAPRIELFARSRHEGWDAWGNEVESDDVMGDYQ